jgi:hypothetical protein
MRRESSDWKLLGKQARLGPPGLSSVPQAGCKAPVTIGAQFAHHPGGFVDVVVVAAVVVIGVVVVVGVVVVMMMPVVVLLLAAVVEREGGWLVAASGPGLLDGCCSGVVGGSVAEDTRYCRADPGQPALGTC